MGSAVHEVVAHVKLDNIYPCEQKAKKRDIFTDKVP